MQIQNINNTSYNINHKAIKSVKYSGLYSKANYGEELYQKLKSNPRAMEFFKNKNVKIVFNALSYGFSTVESNLKIYYTNKPKTWLKKILPSYKKMEIGVSLNKHSISESLEATTNRLKAFFVPRENTQDKDFNDVWSGLLDWRIEKIDK